MTLRHRLINFVFLPALVLSLSVALVPSAEAATIVALDDPSTLGLDFVFNDGDFDGFVDSGGFISVGAFPAALAVGIGNAAGGRLDLAGIMGSFAEGASLNVLFTQTGLTGFGTAFSAINGTTAGNLFYAAYYDPSDAAFGLANLIGSGLAFGPSVFAGDTFQAGVGGLSYSLTQVVTLTHPGGGRINATNFSAAVQVVPAVVPEPATMTLFGLGLGASALARRRGARQTNK